MIPLPASLGGTGALAGWTLQDARYAVTWNSGIGSATYGGRWNSIGKHVIYSALDPATAILEVAVHKGFKVLNTVAHNLYSFTITDPGQVRVVQPDEVPKSALAPPHPAEQRPAGVWRRADHSPPICAAAQRSKRALVESARQRHDGAAVDDQHPIQALRS